MTEKNHSKFKKFIKNQYDMESLGRNQERSTRSITITFTAENACMFAAIARRFDKSTSAFGGDVFQSAVLEMFQALSPEDRITVATESDIELTRYLKAKGVNITNDIGGDENITWRRYADFLNNTDQEHE